MHRLRLPAHRPATRPIIALALLAIGIGDGFSSRWARAEVGGGVIAPLTLALPPLANTTEGDRSLLREIGDEHVHGDISGAPAAPLELRFPDSPIADDVWSRVRLADRLSIPDNAIVHEQVRALRGQTRWISELLHRGTPFVGHVVDALDARYLPLELVLVPVIESGFRPRATSSEQAAGLWQIMPATAGEIGIERSDWYDGRADVVTSTTAALDYLSYLNAEFHGDWELTLAAYNAGPGRVRAAIRRNREAGRSEDFWSLALPAETRAYVPKLLGLLALLRDADGGGLDVPRVPLEPAFAPIDVGRRISLDRAAEVGRVSERLLRRLNAGLLRGVTPPSGPHVLYLPHESADDFLERLAAAGPGTLFSLPRSHDVVAGDTLSDIAVTYGVSTERLMALNGLDGPAIRAGQTLAVLDARHADGASVAHVVNPGDTLSGIARRYDVELGDITGADGEALHPDLIHPGDTLLVNLVAPDAG